MADKIYQPHDKLFRAVFSDAREAADLLQASLPDTLRNRFDWTTLTLVDGTFLDDDLRESQSDLLYRVEHVETGQQVLLYLLFEHQSSPDRWMRFRLLKYCCRIWEADLRDDPQLSELRPILPVVFYQGQGAGAIPPNSPICSPKLRGPGRGLRHSRTSCWTRRPWSPKRWRSASRAVSPSY